MWQEATPGSLLSAKAVLFPHQDHNNNLLLNMFWTNMGQVDPLCGGTSNLQWLWSTLQMNLEFCCMILIVQLMVSIACDVDVFSCYHKTNVPMGIIKVIGIWSVTTYCCLPNLLPEMEIMAELLWFLSTMYQIGPRPLCWVTWSSAWLVIQRAHNWSPNSRPQLLWRIIMFNVQIFLPCNSH